MKLEKVILPCGQIYLNVYLFRNDMKFRYGRFYIGILSISNSTPEMSCFARVFSTALVTHFSDFFS